MAGISATALSVAREDLETRLPSAPLSLAEELFSILSVLDSNAGLRRALTDPARDRESKVNLVSNLFAQQVSTDAIAVTAGLASARWAAARDIGDALETLAGLTAISVAERRGNGSEGLDSLEADLYAFKRVVASNHELQRALADGRADDSAKANLAKKLVPGASEEARLLIRQAVVAPRGLKPSGVVERFIELVGERQQRWIAEVSVSRPMSQIQLSRLESALNGLYNRDLTVHVAVDPALVGGIRVKVADEVVDSSVITRLNELGRRMAG
ncbi:F0F1 ATP synthase subunit delta [Arthrobacter roseus]|uniref:F0F1 ATP synthase subunit delta n=1 Tax=Arthrobacter roseus TaxID=136274 RepID=UPI0019655180|nr:F0F1 ATP synthase subunit delta [Arthrobacter roseus]MBM7849013.1 F-type H+-transporting ATPase subunit delta [Arthrobacter roseus]